MTFKMYCACGASLIGTVKPAASAEALAEDWRKKHSGPGHAPCDQATAQWARRKIDRAEAKKVEATR